MAGEILHFSKYHGFGNHFIVIDGTQETVTLTVSQRRRMCDTKYGIGADGMLVLRQSKNHAFLMDYYNSDGNIGSLCGNGSRCGLAFARKIRLFKDTTVTFEAYDGVHFGRYIANQDKYAINFLDTSLENIEIFDERNYFVDTGSPHHVRIVNDLEAVDVISEGQSLRYGIYKDRNGANIDFVEIKPEGVFVRTYERGVEDETESCGTGAVAVALVTAIHAKNRGNVSASTGSRDIISKGGTFTVKFNFNKECFSEIVLIGEATHVFDGVYDIRE